MAGVGGGGGGGGRSRAEGPGRAPWGRGGLDSFSCVKVGDIFGRGTAPPVGVGVG